MPGLRMNSGGSIFAIIDLTERSEPVNERIRAIFAATVTVRIWSVGEPIPTPNFRHSRPFKDGVRQEAGHGRKTLFWTREMALEIIVETVGQWIDGKYWRQCENCKLALG